MKFLEKSVSEILEKHPDLSNVKLIFPGKRPGVFIKKILEEKQYSGFLPEFFTIEEFLENIANTQEIKGISLWLFAFEVYGKSRPSENFADFIKWFPTLLKDWDDMLKFSENDTQILKYLLEDEHLKNWGETLGDEENARKKYLNFWKKMNVFLPELKQKLQSQNLATRGMIHEKAKQNIPEFAEKTPEKYVFLGFNAFSPAEEILVKNLLQQDKAECFFNADRYYFDDEKQEAGTFLRTYKTWKEFNGNREFKWIEDDFSKPKNIKVFEVPGNVAQTKLIPEILKNISFSERDEETAIVLPDENLLPALLDSLSGLDSLNITMGFPLKNLAFSNAVKRVFYLQKQLAKNASTYYYNDVFPILEEMPKSENDEKIIRIFTEKVEERNIVFIPKKMIEEHLHELRFFKLLQKQDDKNLVSEFIRFCEELSRIGECDDILYENIAHFEKNFKIIQNQIGLYDFPIEMETLEILMNQLVNLENIDFQGEPLEGLQVMGLLETRLLDFKNVIILSVNEGKLPPSNSQNSYIPFNVRKHFGLHTFLETDIIYAYYFYRLIQNSENIYLMFNALTSGLNTGEKSRFVMQLEVESGRNIENIVIENPPEPVEQKPVKIEKTEKVLEKLNDWKRRVSVSHLVNYLYNPIDFYLSKVLNASEIDEIEEELSQRNFGNLMHYSLQNLYEKIKGKVLIENDLQKLLQQTDEAIERAIEQLKHQPEFYERGMNFIHKSVAKRVLENILNHDLNLVKSGNTLEIIDLERNFQDIDFYLNEEKTDKVSLYGFIDRIDKLNGKLRILDYKTGKTKNLKVKINEENAENYFYKEDKKQAMQLCVYQYVISKIPEFENEFAQTGIWSFAEVNKGVSVLEFADGNLDEALISVRNLILEILNPEIAFEERV
ncbi:MAG: PD-(D/E)XK nuclease family protein [Flavobacteriaceae bacterium]|jgi:hypothetical protein|nr:PD-(D/E)XK nuclease family protein [Flavobacteriaceae bacterium]